MSTMPRPEISKKNPYWLERHRYYELKHFCLQYPYWRTIRSSIDSLVSSKLSNVIFLPTNETSDPTARASEARYIYDRWIDMVERTALKTDKVIGQYILIGVTTGVSFDVLNARYNVPCCRDIYYDLYRRFFWLLSKERQ